LGKGDDEANLTATAPFEAADGAPPPAAVLGHFTLGKMLGAGGMGIVFAAHDTDLDRPVALKLVRPGNSSAVARVRLVREGKALARLSHPNVVTVYEISAVDDQVFIVMELVDGTTLRDWMRREAHPWRDVVRLFTAAGRGLQAAHAIGLVHRDFKPSNVLIDGGGAIKVSDFGLVGTGDPLRDELEEIPPPVGAAADGLTHTGAVMGTPAYMAPEQQRGERLDARADQYSFCLSLYEALTGRLPPERRALERQEAAETAPRPLPRRLGAILARGMSPEPEARFPSMRELLAALDKAAAPRRWPYAAAALVVAGGVTAATVRRGDPCPTPTLAGTWDAARREAMRARLAALDPADGASRLAAATGLVDRFAGDLSSMRVSSCRATRVEGRQSDTLFDLRARCLDRRRDELSAATALVVSARDRLEIDRAVAALAELTPVASCGDANALAQLAPEKPRDRQRADELLRERANLETQRRAGRLDGLLPRAEELVAQARALGNPATLSSALLVLAEVQLERGEKAAGHATLEQLTQTAAEAHDDAAAATAWARLVGLIGDAEGKPKEALALLPAARAAVVRAGNDPRQRVELLLNEAIVRDGSGGVPEALQRLAEASAILVAAGADRDASPLMPRLADVEMEHASALSVSDKYEEADAAYRHAIALYRRAFGPDHPEEAYGWHNLGETLRHRGRLDEALDAYRHAARIRADRQGETPLLAGTLVSIGATFNASDRFSEAVAPLERALEIMRAHVPAGDPSLVPALMTAATSYRHVGRIAEARRNFDEAIAIGEKTGATKTNLAITFYNRGELEADAGDWNAALADDRHALELFTASPTMHAYQLAYPLLSEGRALVTLGRAAEAIAPLTRAVALDAAQAAEQKAQARVWLGRALVETGKGERGRAMMRAGREELVKLGPGAAAAVREADGMIAKLR
jgi:eukaryotic-like serine/threonine-protein kinase